MSAAIKLLDTYAKTCYARSDAEIGRNLGLTRATVNGWRKGASHPDAESVEKMADAIGEPVGPWLATIEAERARTPAGRKVWLRLAATLGTTLALAVIALPSHPSTTAPEHCLLCQISSSCFDVLESGDFRVVDGQKLPAAGSYGTSTAAPLNSPLRRSVSASFARSSG